ncbi:MAG: hypothetical protein ACRDLB_07850 [Actinomycetota bacterium]
MARVSFDFDTATTPEQIREAMLDFSDRRPRLWKDLAPKYYEVYSVGHDTADVKEGSGLPFNIWAREGYDWSQPNTITWTVQDSNFCRPGLGVSMTITPTDDGGSKVHVDWEREPTTLRGKILLGMVARNDGSMLKGFVRKGVDSLPETLAANPRPSGG